MVGIQAAVGLVLIVYALYIISCILEWCGKRSRILDSLLKLSSVILNWTLGWLMGVPRETAFSYRLQRYIKEDNGWRYHFSRKLSQHLNWWSDEHIQMEQQEVSDDDCFGDSIHGSSDR